MNNIIGIEKNNIAPYLSILLGAKSNNSEPCTIHDKILEIIHEDHSDDIFIGSTTTEEIGEIGLAKITPYSLSKKPSWVKDLDLKDIENHVFVSFSVRSHFAFYFSEKRKERLN